MRSCAFLTIQNREGWFIDDDLVHSPLSAMGWIVTDVVWNQPTDWRAFDLVVIRSPWDYQHHLDQFFGVLRDIEASSAKLANASNMVRWNVDKTYLLTLQKHGIDIVPTVLGQRPSADWLLTTMDQFATDEIVVKPTIGATADDTFRLAKHASKAEMERVSNVFAAKSCLVQPFLRQVMDEGEYSLIFFDGQLSHAVLKTVQPGDFRVQEEHGGGVVAVPRPEKELVDTARRILACLSEEPLYARVDLVRGAGESFLLMELELVEPCLYFRFDVEAPMRFARAVVKRYGNPLEAQ